MLPTRWLSNGFHRAFLIAIGAACILNNFAWGLAAERSEIAQKAKAILSQKCYSCHGEAGSADGGINFMLDRERLVKRKKLVPGKSGESLIYHQVKAGTMPKGDNPLTADEIDSLKIWIDIGAPDFQAKAKPRTFISPDDVLTFIRDDLRKLDKDDPDKLPYFRYFTITHLYNSGLSDDELRSYRVALSKMVNSLSWKKRIVVPQPIDPAQTVMRICLSDFRWSPKTWERLIAEYPYGVKSSVSAMQFCYSATQSKVPCVRADWFVANASLPPLYHEILELPESVQDLEQLLRIDVEHNIASGDAARLAFNGSGVSAHNRMIERHECDLTGGVYWKSYDFSGVNGSRNLFSHPLGPGGDNGFEHDGGELIFSLPNGLQAYLLVDGEGRRIDKGPTQVVSDPRRPDKQVVNGLSCMSCHAEGVKHKKDEVREAVLANSQAFTATEVAQVKKLYKTNETLEKLFHEDASRFATAVTHTGGKTTGDEPIVMLAMRFEEELDVDTAAAEAGVTTEQFQTNLGKSSNLSRQIPTLKVAGGTVKRELFAAMFPTLVRELRLGQFVGATAEEVASRGTIPDIPDIPSPKKASPKTSSKPSSVAKSPTLKSSVKVSTAPVTLANFDAAIQQHFRDMSLINNEHLELRRKLIDKVIPRLRDLQTKSTKAGQLDQAVTIRTLADTLAKESDSKKQMDLLRSASRLPDDVATILTGLMKELQTDSDQTSAEVTQLTRDYGNRFVPVAVAALIAGDLEQSRKVVSTVFSFRGESARSHGLGRRGSKLEFPEETLKFVDPFKEKSEQRLVKANREDQNLRKTLIGNLKAEAKRKDLEATQMTALEETIDFFEADFSEGLRMLQIFKPNRKLPDEAQTLVTEYLAAAKSVTAALVNEHSSAWETLNEQLSTLRKSLANDQKFETALLILEQMPNLKRVFEPISVKAPYTSGAQFTSDAEILEAKDGKYLLRHSRGFGGVEWVTRDRFYVGGGSGDSAEAIQSIAQSVRNSQPPAGFPRRNEPPPGEPVTKDTKLKKGQKVLIQEGFQWKPVTILELTPAGPKIHWEGYSDAWDKVVDRSLLRLPAE